MVLSNCYKGIGMKFLFIVYKLLVEIRVMGEKFPNWKFLLIWLVFLILASGYFVGQIRW